MLNNGFCVDCIISADNGDTCRVFVKTVMKHRACKTREISWEAKRLLNDPSLEHGRQISDLVTQNQ
jgi:hypothetical protein